MEAYHRESQLTIQGQQATLNANALIPARAQSDAQLPVVAAQHNLGFCNAPSDDDKLQATTLIVRKPLYMTKVEIELHRDNIFRTRCTVSQKVCNVIIDVRSSENLMSKIMVEKLQLKTEKHPSPYTIGWIKEVNKTEGVATLTLSATPVVPHRFQKSLFYISLYVLAIGQGGQKPCAQAFGADQFNEESAQEMEAMNSFFNWWYFGTTCGVVAGIIIISYVQEYVGWAIGFSIPAIAVAIALVTFHFGRKSYRRRSPTGSPLTQVAQVLVAAARKRHLSFVEVDQEEGKEGRMVYLPMNGSLSDANQFRFLDKATIKDELDASCESRNAWRLCSTIQVEETKQLLRLLPIWFSCLMFAVVTAQTSTFFTKQCSTLDRKIWSSFEVTPASFQLSIALSAILTVPIYNWIIVPLLRTITKTSSGITLLQRIGVGISLSVTCMVIAALVEARRLRIAREHGLADIPNATIPMSVWWLLPQDVICGFANVLTIAGLNQFFYDQMPDEMRSLGSAAVASIFGVGNFLSSFILSFLEMINSKWLANNLNHGHLDYYYWLLAGLSTLWLGFYTSLAQCFVCKQNNDALR